ncbi:MAG: HupE/UreJ family protein, partial [Nannocystaceae bacterium]
PAPETWSRSFACTAGELRGELAVVGLEDSRVDAVLLLQLSDRQESLVLSASEPSVVLGHDPGETARKSALGYLEVGTRHILAGWDHLAFVLGLVWLLVHRSHHPTCDRWQLARRLLAAITAFTLGHSASLAAVTLGGLPLAVEPVEALIALSVVLLARELVHASGPTTTVKTSIATHPWRMASLFGLVHGCGFAGALTEIGLPPGTFAVALAAFNIGVELGQLAVVAGLLIILLPLFAGLPPRLHRYLTVTAGYCLGIVASAWTLARILAFWNQP